MTKRNMTNRFLDHAQKEFPNLELMPRTESLFMRVIFTPLAWVTRRKDGYKNFATTIGRKIYLPENWENRSDLAKYALLRHEIVHVRQFHYYPIKPLGKTPLWFINAFITGLLYLLVLPVFFTFREKFEREGYTQSVLTRFENGLLHVTSLESEIDWLVQTFSTGVYAWMSTKGRARKWATKMVHDVYNGKIENPHDRVNQLED